MSIEKTSSFYLTVVSPSLTGRASEFAISLPSELLFAEHETWYVGLTNFAKVSTSQDNQQQQQQQQQQLSQSITATPGGGDVGGSRQARRTHYKFWVREHPFSPTNETKTSNGAHISPKFVLSARLWEYKKYEISIDKDRPVAVSIPMGNYTWEALMDTITEMFNDGCVKKKLNLRMEIKSSTMLFHRTSRSGTRASHVIEFSNDLFSLLNISERSILIDSTMWSTMLAYGGKVHTFLEPKPTSATGTFTFPLIQQYGFAVEEKTLVAGKNVISTRAYTLVGGVWTFEVLADYLNSILQGHGVEVTMDTNYVFQAGSMDVQNIYIGKMKFVKKNKIETVTINLSSALQSVLNFSLDPIVLATNDQVVEGQYRIPLQRLTPVTIELTAAINAYTYTDREIGQALNQAQKDSPALRYSAFYFDEDKLNFYLPPQKHEFTQYDIQFEKALAALLGLPESLPTTSCLDNGTTLSKVAFRRPSSTALMLPNDSLSGGGGGGTLRDRGGGGSNLLRNTVYWIYTDVVNNDQMVVLSSASEANTFDSSITDKYKLLRVMTYSENSDNNVIYPIHYIQLDRHRMSVIYFKVFMNSDDTSPIVMTLHFARS